MMGDQGDASQAHALAADGYLEAAVDLMRAHVVAHPNDANGRAIMGRYALYAGDYATAQKCYQWLSKNRRADDDLYFHALTLALLRKSKAFAKAMPSLPGAWQRIIQGLAGLQAYATADTIAQQARNKWPDDDDLLLDHGVVAAARGRAQEALGMYKHVLIRIPSNAAAQYNLARTLYSLGQRSAAIDAVSELVSAVPDHINGIRLLGALNASLLSDETYVAHLYERAADTGTDEQAKAHIHYALGRAKEQIGDIEQAVAHYRRGGELKRQQQPYNVENDFRLMQALEETAYAWGTDIRPAASDLTLLMVVGMPRSGTTLVEQILGSHSKIDPAGETSVVRDALLSGLAGQTGFHTPIDKEFARGIETPSQKVCKNIWKQVATAYRSLGHRARFIADKTPRNLIYAPLMLSMFPNVKVVIAKRDLRDTCVSCMTMDFDATYGFCDDLIDLGRYAVQSAAFANRLSENFPERVFVVDYEALAAAPEQEIPRLLQFIGLPMELACLSPEKSVGAVGTASAAQVRQPINVSAVGRWERYAPYIVDLLEILAEHRHE